MGTNATERLYTLLLHVLRPALPLVARGEGKLGQAVRGRRGVLERMARWGAEQRDPARPVAWFHAPSVGEGLQARAVIEALRLAAPEVQVVYTFFSPSAERFARSVPAGFTDYLPFDLPSATGRALDALRPDVLVFSKTDVWPNLSRQAAERGIPMLLLSATLPASSSRVSSPARRLLGPAYRRLTHVAAISADDSDRFAGLGVPDDRRSVMGDARFDQVLARAAGAESSPWVGRLRSDGHFVLVAGSTWPPDEQVLLSALRHAGHRAPPLRLVLAPHEPTEAHLAETEALLRRYGFHSQRLAEVEDGPVTGEVVLVDRVGVLGDLYAVADAAYVGGGWGTAGLHSVLEPASFGAPVLFGPRHSNAREAGELVRAGAAFSVDDEEELRDRIALIWDDVEARRQAGAAARRYVEAGRGAAARGAELVLERLRRD